MTLKKEQFGKLDNGEQVEKVTLTNKNGVVVEVKSFFCINLWYIAIGFASMNIFLQLMNYGATIISIKVPSKNGLTDVVLGFDEIDGYLR